MRRRRLLIAGGVALVLAACGVAAWFLWSPRMAAKRLVREYFELIMTPEPRSLTWHVKAIEADWENCRPFVEEGVTHCYSAVRRNALGLIRDHMDERSVPALLAAFEYPDDERRGTRGVIANLLAEKFGDIRALIPIYEAIEREYDIRMRASLETFAEELAQKPWNGFSQLSGMVRVGNEEQRAFAIKQFKLIHSLDIIPYFLSEMKRWEGHVRSQRTRAARILWFHCNTIPGPTPNDPYEKFEQWWKEHEHIYRDPEKNIPRAPSNTTPEESEVEEKPAKQELEQRY